MKFITRTDYLEYLTKYPKIMLKDKEEKYKLESKENKKYNKQTIEEVDKKHDKMFKVILSRKDEMANFLNQFLNLKEKIKEEQLVQCPTEFVTKRYKNKHLDILYKLKEMPIYFLVEHQSTVDKEMIERIGIYVEEIMRKEKNYGSGIYPVIVPIVIYTGFQKWNVKTKFREMQYQALNYEEYQMNLWYNLITVQDCTFEELLEKKTLFSSIMIMEKCRTKEELTVQIEKVIEMIEKEEDRKILSEIIDNIIVSRLGTETTNKIIQKIKGKEETSMSPLTKMLFDLEIKGERKGIIKTAQKMLQKKMKMQDIEEITGLSKEEIKKLEKCV